MEANAILAALRIAQAQAQASGETSTQPSPLEECGLANLDCPLCHNTGCIVTKTADNTLKAVECSCMPKRISIRNLERSGLKDMIERYTFDSYKTDTEERKAIKASAERFCEAETGWFYISGKNGGGKTHICTAICSRLMDKGLAVRYMIWRDAATELKSLVNDADAYQERMKPLKRIPVLYIDDFLKGGCTDADLRLAFEILNARYNDSRLRTVISSELSLYKIMDLDEATGGRIYERSKQFVVNAPSEDWRLK